MIFGCMNLQKDIAYEKRVSDSLRDHGKGLDEAPPRHDPRGSSEVSVFKYMQWEEESLEEELGHWKDLFERYSVEYEGLMESNRDKRKEIEDAARG